VAVVRPELKTLVRASQVQPLLLEAFSFAPDAISGFFTVEDLALLNANHEERPVAYIPSTHPVAQQFAALCAPGEMKEDLLKRGEVLCLGISFFLQRPGHRPAAPVLDAPGQCRFLQIIGKMQDMELIQYTPEELARLCGCSPRHFFRLFRKHYGVSVGERRTELGLNKARRLLEETESRIQQVALDCGYHSLSLFNLRFKRRFGLTPSAFRRRAQQSVQEAVELG
jgi:AraC-like DNA-binding protein